MNQQPHQQQQYAPPRRTGTYGSQHDELHMPPPAMSQSSGQMSPRDYPSTQGSHMKFDQASPGGSSYHSASSVPNVLHPGGMAGARPPAMQGTSQPSPQSQQQQQPPPPQQQHQSDYSSSSSRPPSIALSHGYSRSSPAVGAFDGAASSYAPYTPATPGGSASTQYMSPVDKYSAAGSQRNVSNAPLGLADIRPRTESGTSDGMPGTLGYDFAHAQPGTSNYLAPWALYAMDWCKWSPQGNSAGKLAVASYLEDGHNFVRSTGRGFATPP